MENTKDERCKHCNTESKSIITKGKLTLISPDGRDYEVETEVVVCLNCGNIRLFSQELLGKVR